MAKHSESVEARMNVRALSTGGELYRIVMIALLSGVPAVEVTARIVERGLTDSESAAFVAQVMNDDLFKQLYQRWVRLRSREWFLATQAELAVEEGHATTVPVATTIGADEFRRDYYLRNRPLLLRGIASGWPATRLWTRDYLNAKCGHTKVEVMSGRNAAPVAKRNTSVALRTELSLSKFLEMIYTGGASNDFYMVSRNRFFDRPGTRQLMDDFQELPFVSTRNSGEHVRMWLGPAGTVTPLHYDDRNNLIVQIVGTKTVRLIGPYWSEYMDQAQAWYARVDPAGDQHAPPEMALELRPGDALFIPVGWWHALTAVDVSITLSFDSFALKNRFEFSIRQDQSLRAMFERLPELR